MAGEFKRAEKLCRDSLERDWEKGLSPELLARMPRWQGTFETRAHSLLSDIYKATKREDESARERMLLPSGYKRPSLENAIPVPGLRPVWPRPPGPVPFPAERLLDR